MSIRVLDLNSVKDTTLWKTLSQSGDQNAKFLSTNLLSISDEAFNRMKLTPIHFQEYTLHDAQHLLRVMEIASMILGDNISRLNPIEISLLILSILMHDQGMIMPHDQYEALSSNKEFIVFRDNWYIEHPNKNEIEKYYNSLYLKDEEKHKINRQLLDLENALMTDYLRINHGARSAEFVKSEYGGDKRIEVCGVNLASFISKLASSHCISVDKLSPHNSFNYDELIGTYKINMPYIGIILRLADLLDFDNERTPDILFRSIHFTNELSIQEWNKHRGVIGWQIGPKELIFSMQFQHPVYEVAARKFLDFVDYELSECHSFIRNFPASFAGYILDLPSKVNRSRIYPVDSSYIFYDLEFSISRDEIVKLLMTDKLYSKPSLCIRELLQNSLDALRYRKSLFGYADISWDKGMISLIHDIDRFGHEIIICEDNGIGMDEKIITNFLCKAGRSYYRSSEFESLRLEFKSKNVDFDPCSQFGIGFMSCFMLADRIMIETRKDYGIGKEIGKPLIVEINGLGGIVVIREGLDNQQIGTKVTLISRKKPNFFDEWIDQVNLLTIIKGFALATEFPISAECKIKEIKGSVIIPPIIERPKTYFEYLKLSEIITLETKLNDINSNIDGYLRESFLLDQSGLPTIKNDYGEWIIEDFGNNAQRKFQPSKIQPKSEEIEFFRQGISARGEATVSIDGILVAGEGGRESYKKEVMFRLGSKYSHIYSHAICLIDIRGNIKPDITPSRSVPEYSGLDMPPKWERVQHYVTQGEGRIWEKITEYLEIGLYPETYWKLVSIYNFWTPNLRFEYIWKFLLFPYKDKKENYSWIKLENLKSIDFIKEEDEVIFTSGDFVIGLPKEIMDWENETKDKSIAWYIKSTILVTSSLDYRDNKFTLTPTPYKGLEIPAFYFITRRIGVRGCFIEFSSQIKKGITAETCFPIGNRDHPLSKIYFESLYLKNKSDIQEFASSFVPCIVDLISEKNKKNSLSNPGRWAIYCAYKYLEVDWKKYSLDLAAPYHVLLKNNEWFEITEDTFDNWRKLPIPG